MWKDIFNLYCVFNYWCSWTMSNFFLHGSDRHTPEYRLCCI